MKDYTKLRGVLQPGDLVLYHYPGFQFIADAIEWFEGDGQVSHNSMSLGPDGNLHDVLITGVQKTHISRYTKGKTQIIIRRIVGIHPHTQKAMVMTAVQEFGRDYSIRKIAWNALVLLAQKIGLGGWLVRNNPFRREVGKTCSGSYARIALYNGHELCPGIIPENVTPQDLLESQKLVTVADV